MREEVLGPKEVLGCVESEGGRDTHTRKASWSRTPGDDDEKVVFDEQDDEDRGTAVSRRSSNYIIFSIVARRVVANLMRDILSRFKPLLSTMSVRYALLRFRRRLCSPETVFASKVVSSNKGHQR